jgi:hypothetical protein
MPYISFKNYFASTKIKWLYGLVGERAEADGTPFNIAGLFFGFSGYPFNPLC